MPEFSDSRLKTPEGDARAYYVSAGAAPIFETAETSSRLATEALHGETLRVFDIIGVVAKVQLDRDEYVGFARLSDLTASNCTITHKIASVRTHAYPEPDLKTRPRATLSMGAGLKVEAVEGDWADCGALGWVHTRHITPVEIFESDPATVAERFIGTPYIWGGRQSLGIDCTGLTQQAFEACGVMLPRDSDMQFAWSGSDVLGWSQAGALRRGDLVFWKGHVGIMMDSETLLHANAWHMAVAKEPLSGAIERIKQHYAEPIGARRVDVQTSILHRPDWLK